LRQLVRQRSLGAAAAPAASLVVVSGGKGGVGTTTVAINLAVALARQGRRAVFVDADMEHGGNTQIGPQLDRGCVLDVLAGRRNVHEVLQRGPSGIQVLSGAWAAQETAPFSAAAQDRFIADLKHLAPHAEVVVIDAGGGRGHFVRRFWHAAGTVLIVTTPDDAAVMQCYAAIKVLVAGDASVPIRALVNRASNASATADVQARIAEACRRFLGLRLAAGCGVGPCETISKSEPCAIFPAQSDSARALDRMADALWTQLQSETARETQARRA